MSEFTIPEPEDIFNPQHELESRNIDLVKELFHFADLVFQHYREIDQKCGLFTNQADLNKYRTEIKDAASYLKKEVAEGELELTPENASSEYRLIEIYQAMDRVCIASNALKLHNEAKAQITGRSDKYAFIEHQRFANPERFILSPENLIKAKAVLSSWQMNLAKFILDNRNSPDIVNITSKIWDRLVLVESARHGRKEYYEVSSLRGGVRSLVATVVAISVLGEYSCYLPKPSQDLQGIDLFITKKNHLHQAGVVAVQIGSTQNIKFQLIPIPVDAIMSKSDCRTDADHRTYRKRNSLLQASHKHQERWGVSVSSVYIDLLGAGPANMIVDSKTGLPLDVGELTQETLSGQLPKVLKEAFGKKGGEK